MSEVGERCSGVCKWFSDDKGFGFIVLAGQDKDIFVHRQQLIRSGIDKLSEGEHISFTLEEGRKGKFATSIKREA